MHTVYLTPILNVGIPSSENGACLAVVACDRHIENELLVPRTENASTERFLALDTNRELCDTSGAGVATATCNSEEFRIVIRRIAHWARHQFFIPNIDICETLHNLLKRRNANPVTKILLHFQI